MIPYTNLDTVVAVGFECSTSDASGMKMNWAVQWSEFWAGMRFLDFKLSCIASRRANISWAIRSSSCYNNNDIYSMYNYNICRFMVALKEYTTYNVWELKGEIVSWEPEGRYCSSKMFRWEPEGRYRCTKVDGDSALLVLNGTSLNFNNALLALNWRDIKFPLLYSASPKGNVSDFSVLHTSWFRHPYLFFVSIQRGLARNLLT